MATQISSLTTLVNGVNSYDCFLPLVDPTLALDSRNVKVRISTHNEMFSNNFAVANLSSYSNYFGTGKDGSVTISSSAQISSSTSPAGLNNISREFGDTIVKNYQNLTINSGVLFSPLRACRGMIIYCTGNLTINGTVSMTGKGGGVGAKIASPIGAATSTDSRYDLVDATLYFNNFSSSTAGGYGIPTHWNWAPSGSVWFSNYKIRIPLSGSVSGGSTTGANGTAGVFCCGGGGAGGNNGPYGVGIGARGTIFTGGAGGGGGNIYGGGGSATTFEYQGGNGVNGFSGQGTGGGAGLFAGSGGGGTPAGSSGGIGVGGLILLIVRGTITINGTISSNGANGGAGAIGGGGSGGGRIIIVYGNTYTNSGTVVANGGSGGSGSPSGGSGGAGSITVRKVHI
jgi:hypothetical protein